MSARALGGRGGRQQRRDALVLFKQEDHAFGALPKERLLALAQAIYKQQPAPVPAASAAAR